MGLHFRKSINLGGGFRINLSKHGVGYSWGVKGARFTKTAHGTARTTLSIPGTGIYYTKETKLKKNTVKPKKAERPDIIAGPEYNLETIKTSEGIPFEYKDFLDTIKRIRLLNGLGITLLILSTGFFSYGIMPLGILSILIGVVIIYLTHTKYPIHLEYEYDEETKENYSALCEAWKTISKCKSIRQLISETYVDSKTFAGVKRSITKSNSCSIIKKAPYFLKVNMEVFGIRLSKGNLLFLPDKLLVISPFNVGALNYDDVKIDIGKAHIPMAEKGPRDSQVIGQTWIKVNKDGTPDKRFKNNKKVNIYEYGMLVIESGNRLHAEIVFSNASLSPIIRDSLKKYFKIK